MTDDYFYSLKNILTQHLNPLKGDVKMSKNELIELGKILPASIMLHDLVELKPVRVSYMNDWGCKNLGVTVNEINRIGDSYYDRYFIKEETAIIFKELGEYLMAGNFEKQYNFFQRVKLHNSEEYDWFFSVCKLIKMKTKNGSENKLIMIASPLEGADLMIRKLNKILEEEVFVKNNYRSFARLTNREKVIITLIATGKSSKEIAEELFISIHTINTHRKNIARKTNFKTFPALLKFAQAFELA